MFEKLTRSRYMTENVTDELIRLENLVKIYDTGAIRVMGLKKINLDDPPAASSLRSWDTPDRENLP